MYAAIRDELCHAWKSWHGTLVDPCLLSVKNRPEIEFCPMHTYKHASGVYNACETAKFKLDPSVDVIHTDNVGKFLQGYDKLTSRVENFSPAIGRGIDSRNRVWN